MPGCVVADCDNADVSEASSMDEPALLAGLRGCGAELAPGLTDAQLDRAQDHFGFLFAPDHRLMLSLALPIGREWPDWRQLDSELLRSRVDWPFESILFDVEHNDFWPDYWGDRPAVMAESIQVAREQLARVPKVAPLFVHRCVPTVPHAAGNPVLSCYQTDVIYYGSDLINWFEREFYKPKKPLGPIDRRLPFWTALVEMDPDSWGPE
jgi:hypothetical protein